MNGVAASLKRIVFFCVVNNTKITRFQLFILNWFAENARHFPWREKTVTPFELVVSEILLQRTKAETVAKNYRAFFDRFPDWQSLAKLSETELAIVLYPFGLNKLKAKRLHMLVEQLNESNFELDKKENIDKLPLFGLYTANAYYLLVLKRPAPLLDVNMARVLERIFGPKKLKDYRYDKDLRALANTIVDSPYAKEINWGILDFAAVICRPNPRCPDCDFRYECLYYQKMPGP